MLDLYIGNKNYSTWSLRAWILLKVYAIEFAEHWIQFDKFSTDNIFKQRISKIHPAATVPLLSHQGFVISDSLAICEYLAELFPEKHLWPQALQQRARARAICAEIHSGFHRLRELCPMNIEADLNQIGSALWLSDHQLREEITRIQNIWAERPQSHSFLCGDQFTIADAFYVPVILRLRGYGLPIAPINRPYVARIMQLPALQQWINAALQEHCFICLNEPYRKAR